MCIINRDENGDLVMSQRKEKVAQRIKEEISIIIHDKIKDPRIGFLTITKVELTSDLRTAKAFYSVLGEDDKKKEAREGLKSANKYIRKLLGDTMELRYTPEIIFKLDTSTEYNLHIGMIFDKIEKERLEKEEKGNDDQKTDS
ncbi:MAG: 30S ribosome-binding factor RbfA [Candidatus Omnitrophica bacterium]|nr:30S ribosome-binding factor RbfA [Candidatus Omnitrophota bacterium]